MAGRGSEEEVVRDGGEMVRMGTFDNPEVLKETSGLLHEIGEFWQISAIIPKNPAIYRDYCIDIPEEQKNSIMRRQYSWESPNRGKILASFETDMLSSITAIKSSVEY